MRFVLFHLYLHQLRACIWLKFKHLNNLFGSILTLLCLSQIHNYFIRKFQKMSILLQLVFSTCLILHLGVNASIIPFHKLTANSARNRRTLSKQIFNNYVDEDLLKTKDEGRIPYQFLSYTPYMLYLCCL